MFQQVSLNINIYLKDNEPFYFRFYFDGEELDAEDTCHSLELEGGECIDVHET